MRFDIRYGLRFAYDEPIWESQNEVRVRPRDSARQHVISHRVRTRPAVRVLSFVDYWGTTVDHVGMRGEHREFEILSEAVVETVDDDRPDDPGDPRALTPLGDLGEFLVASAHTGITDEVRDAAADADPGVDSGPEERAGAISAAVGSLLTYTPGSTEIGTSPAEVLAGGAGVCQDYAHLSLAMLRSLQVPARYVSGYLFAADETDLRADTATDVVVQTHAWFEVAVPERGWIGLDPTNGTRVGARHVSIGHGRDYDDVPPLVGTYSGAAQADVHAEVRMARTDSVHDRAVARAAPGLREPISWVTGQQQQQQQQ